MRLCADLIQLESGVQAARMRQGGHTMMLDISSVGNFWYPGFSGLYFSSNTTTEPWSKQVLDNGRLKVGCGCAFAWIRLCAHYKGHLRSTPILLQE